MKTSCRFFANPPRCHLESLHGDLDHLKDATIKRPCRPHRNRILAADLGLFFMGQDMVASPGCPENDGRRVFPHGCCLGCPVTFALWPVPSDRVSREGLQQDASRRIRMLPKGVKGGQAEWTLDKKSRVHSLRDLAGRGLLDFISPFFRSHCRNPWACRREPSVVGFWGQPRSPRRIAHCHAMLPSAAPDLPGPVQETIPGLVKAFPRPS
jgi:hypothetical protein